MKKIICMFLTLLLLVCIVGCSQTKDSDIHVVQDYSEEYEVSPYGSEIRYIRCMGSRWADTP